MKLNKFLNGIFVLVMLFGGVIAISSCSKDDGEEGGGNANYGKHEFVDLGLSVKWASCNIGATSPEAYGDYYAWGETEPKTNYDWTTYKYCSSSRFMIKYSINYGVKDNITTLELEDDVAHVKWGGTWRMPTITEFEELTYKCIWTWTTKGGVNGYEVKSKINGNSIFLPAAGLVGDRYDSSKLIYAGEDGFYWSASLSKERSYYASRLQFNSESKFWKDEGLQREGGLSVRAVCE